MDSSPARLLTLARILHEEVRHTVKVDGVSLDVIAIKLGAKDWQLSIENELGIRSVWYEGNSGDSYLNS